MDRAPTSRPSGPLAIGLLLGGGVLFLLLATLNAGGYRYGASDQSFYIPAILARLDASLFPRDSALLAPQSRYFLLDEIVAALVSHVGGRIDQWFLAGQVATLALLYAALVALGATVFRSPLAVTALVAAETLRHRITKTGVNTLEGYFHPRVLVFAIGVTAIVLYLRGRPWWALALVVLGGALHPSTAAFFVLMLGVATWVTDRRTRPWLAAAAALGALLVGWLLVAGPWRGALAPMDEEWVSLLATKDYLFPTADWSPGTWAVNLGTAAIAIGGLWLRVHSGCGAARERGLLAGTLVLLAGFLVTLPGVAAGSALLVQLQISRVFWPIELMAVVVVVWWLVDRRAVRPERRRLAWITLAVLAVASVGRGLYVGTIEHDRALFAPTLPSTDWTRTLDWVSTHTPATTHILADPGHAWKYGVPLRVAGRDVYLEDVKDTAMALYSRDVAARVVRRMHDLGSFDTLTVPKARELAARYELDYLISTATLDLPLAAVEGSFNIYRLR